MRYSADELINWSYDEFGELEWVVFRSTVTRQDSIRTFGWKTETRWIYYDRSKFTSASRRKKAAAIELVEEGPHGFAGLSKVPVFEFKVSDGLWLTNKAALLQTGALQ